MKTVTVVGAVLMAVAFSACAAVTRNNAAEKAVTQKSTNMRLSALKDSIHSFTDDYEAEIGVALITDNGDTVVVNNENKYPLMSVFKLHQAVALCHDFEKAGRSLDTVLSIPRSSLNPDTWSPMLKEHTGDTIKLTVRELLRYTLIQSDNNASNLLFRRFTSVKETDAFADSARKLPPRLRRRRNECRPPQMLLQQFVAARSGHPARPTLHRFGNRH